MIAQVNIPIFSSDTRSIGSAVGRVDIDVTPHIGNVFPWPNDWIAKTDPSLKNHFLAMIVVYSDDKPQIKGIEFAVEVEGAFLSSEVEAREFAGKLEKSAGFIYSDYFA